MALLSLIFNRPVRAQVGAMQLDASLQENHARQATVSQSPIENGSNIADHITLSPIKLSLTGIISDTPLTLISSLVGTGVGAVTDVVGDSLGGIGKTAAAAGVGSIGGLVQGTPKKPEDAFKYLEELYENRVPFTVVTKLKRYENMVIASLNVPRNAQIGKGLQFSLEMEQVTIVQSSVVKIPAFQLKGDSANRGQSTTPLNKQSSKTAKPETERKSSFLLQGFQKIGVFN